MGVSIQVLAPGQGAAAVGPHERPPRARRGLCRLLAAARLPAKRYTYALRLSLARSRAAHRSGHVPQGPSLWQPACLSRAHMRTRACRIVRLVGNVSVRSRRARTLLGEASFSAGVEVARSRRRCATASPRGRLVSCSSTPRTRASLRRREKASRLCASPPAMARASGREPARPFRRCLSHTARLSSRSRSPCCREPAVRCRSAKRSRNRCWRTPASPAHLSKSPRSCAMRAAGWPRWARLQRSTCQASPAAASQPCAGCGRATYAACSGRAHPTRSQSP